MNKLNKKPSIKLTAKFEFYSKYDNNSFLNFGTTSDPTTATVTISSVMELLKK